MNGWTPPIDLETQARNIIARLNAARPDERANKRDVGRLLAHEGGITPEFVRKLNNFVTEIETRERAMRNLETYGEAKLAAIGNAQGVTAFDPGYFTAADEADRQAEINFARYGG